MTSKSDGGDTAFDRIIEALRPVARSEGRSRSRRLAREPEECTARRRARQPEESSTARRPHQPPCPPPVRLLEARRGRSRSRRLVSLTPSEAEEERMVIP